MKRIYPLIIILLSIGVYFNSLSSDFVWDDFSLIVHNKAVHSWDGAKLNLTKINKRQIAETQYFRPLISLSYMADYRLWKKNPQGYHITNLVFHSICALFAFFLIKSLFNNFPLALYSSLLFAVHPIHSEAVSWIAGRTDIFCAVFFFASLYLYELSGSKDRKGLLLLSLISFFLALFSKEMALTLPFFIILADYFKFGAKFWEKIKNWMLYFAVLIIYLAIRYIYLGSGIGPRQTNIFPGLISAMVYYFGKLIYPLNLSAYLIFEGAELWKVIVFVLSIFASVVFIFKKKEYPEISYAILFFWISLIPVMNFIPLSGPYGMQFAAAERFLYIPSLGFCLPAAFLITKIKRKSIQHIILGSLLIFYSAAALDADSYWQSGVTLFGRELKNHPQDYTVNYNMGLAYLNKKEYKQAIPYFNKAAKSKPPTQNIALHKDKIAAAHYQAASCYWLLREKKPALAEIKMALAVKPGFRQALSALSVIKKELNNES